MGVNKTLVYILAGLCASLSKAAPVSDSFAVSVQSPVSVHRSHSTILPCWLNPPQSAEDLEVHWYRSENVDTPILLYRAQMLDASQDAKYKGRVSFGLKDAASGGLKAGDVSLRVANVTLEDAGDYTCYVSSDSGYDKESIRLSVTETGAQPLLSVEWKEANKVNVSCQSAGWYPQPQLRWSDQKQDLNPRHLVHRNDSSGLVSVHSWLLVSGSSEVSCSVGLTDGERKEARLHVGNPAQPADSGSSAAGWVAFALLLISVLALAGLLYFKRKKLFEWMKPEREEEVDGKELTEPLLNNVSAEFTEATEHHVNVTFDTEERPYLFIKDCMVRDRQGEIPGGPSVTCHTAIRGRQGFSSGQHYWEVSLSNEVTGLKRSWWVGVTSATSFSKQPDIEPSSSNGFWFLSSSPDREESFQFSTETKVLLPVLIRPQTLGVYLNYDSGELSFYNVDAKSLVGSLNVRFTGEVFPLFNPGKGDKAPLVIIHKPVEGKQSNKVNLVQSTEPESECSNHLTTDVVPV